MIFVREVDLILITCQINDDFGALRFPDLADEGLAEERHRCAPQRHPAHPEGGHRNAFL